ncbi:MAG: prepilin-type N-terminal cleavage/methylation domain-containing protein [Clostridiaceae bacterium]|nr:prepilin-type N-terminal cleavage/methylation domain-containing protein [Clostridiaceae bacterium]
MRKIKRKNGGFSLVELLVGVLILGLVVSPLLHTMVTAMRTAQKGRTAQDMTQLAQNLIETVDVRGLDSLLQDLSMADSASLGGIAADAAFYVQEDDGYRRLTQDEVAELDTRADTYYLGVTGLRFAGNTMPYDAMVTLDATEHLQNNYPIANYTAMDGVFCQPTDEMNPDTDAAAFFADEVMLIRDAHADLPDLDDQYPLLTAEDFYFSMVRSIVIHVELQPYDDDPRAGTVVATAEYNYSVSYAGEALPSPPPYTTDFYHGPYDLDEANYGVSSFYFFFYPNYPSGSAQETIDIYNMSNIPFRFFLVKQRTPAYYASNQVETDLWNSRMLSCENTYACTLKLRETANGTERAPVASIFTNLGTNIYGGLMTGTSTFRVLKNLWSIQMPVPNQLVDTAERNRLYSVKVDLFPTGSDFASGSRLMTFSGSSVE